VARYSRDGFGIESEHLEKRHAFLNSGNVHIEFVDRRGIAVPYLVGHAILNLFSNSLEDMRPIILPAIKAARNPVRQIEVSQGALHGTVVDQAMLVIRFFDRPANLAQFEG